MLDVGQNPPQVANNMTDLKTLSPQQLRAAADLQEKIETLKQELDQVWAVEVPAPADFGF